MQKRLLVLAVALAGVTLAACGDDNDATGVTPVSKILNFTADLRPGNEPGNLNGNPTGSGTFTATLDTSTNVFTWTSTFSGLTSNISNGHIHGPFVPGGATTSAGVIVNFNPTSTPGATFTGLNSATSGSTTGTITLNASYQPTPAINGDSLRKLILAGAVYVNIHTTSNTGGEIRGQIVRKLP